MARNRNDDRSCDRRRFLQYASVSGAGLLAGCTSNVASDTDDTVTSTDTQTTVETGTKTPYNTSVSHDVSEWERYDPDWEPPTDAPGVDYEFEVLADGLEIPWDISFAPDGSMFVTERTGRILEFDAGELRTVGQPGSIINAESIEPGSDDGSWLVPGGEGGLLGIATHPSYPDPSFVYVYFTTKVGRESGRENRVVAFDVSHEAPMENPIPIVTGIPGETYHNGGRIAFGPANYLWITTGDADAAMETTERTRDPGSLAGKVLRVRPDGTAPESNPDISADADPRVYTYGHRNPQSITWLPDGTPVITEHGPGRGDEINVLRPGADYGWPTARNSGEHERYADTSFQPPVADAESWAPAGGVFYTGEELPSLRNRLLFGGLISQQITAATISPADGPALAEDHDTIHDAEWMDGSYRVGTSTLFPDGLGRVRHVEEGPEGDLYAITSNRDGRATDGFPREDDDRLVRLRPA